jgi:Na+/melibiose symporter-like transporter
MSGITKSQLFAYGLPGMPLAILSLPLYIYLPTFYAEETLLSLTTIGLVLLFARLIDMITDPLTGWLNDHLPARWNALGKRKVFIVAGLPLVLLGVILLLSPTKQTSATELFLYSIITYLGWTLINVPWQAWGAEISRDYHSKSLLSGSREWFAVLGTITALSLPVLLGLGNDATATLASLQNLILILLPLSILVLLLLVKESKAHFQIVHQTAHMKFLGGLLAPHPAVKKLLLPYFINSLANALPATLFILFVTHVLQAKEQIGLLLLIYFVSAMLGLPCWYFMSKRLDKSRTWSIALLIAILSFISVPFLSAGDVNLFITICIVSGFALGADVALPASIQADIAQQLENQGNAQTGLLFGLWSLLSKLALALGVGIAFPLLELSGFEQTATAPDGLLTLALLYAALPILLKIWVAWKMWHFPFSAIDFHDYWEPPK